MTRRLAQLFRLLSFRARIGLSVTAGLLVVERLVLAAGAFGLAGRLTLTWAASAGVVVVWAIRGFVRQSVSKETREKLTMLIAGAALERGADGSFLPGEEADAAVFEGRSAAEQVIIRHAPALFAEPIAAAVLLVAVKPAGIPILAGASAVAIATILVALLRNATTARQRGSWRKYMEVARDTLTSIRAAPELIASGYEKAYLDKLQKSVTEWTETAARAERSAALFQRIPLAAIVVVGVVLIVQTQSFELGHVIRLGVFFPPLAGLMRTVHELVRTAPRIQTLGAALDAREDAQRVSQSTPRKSPPDMPCEIRFEGVSFSYGDVPVLKDVSFVWKPGEVLGIKGPNGAGKSTLLKLMLGLLQPSEGRILVGGVDLREIDLVEWRRGIAYLPQRPYVPEKATVIEAMRLTVPGLTDEEAQTALQHMAIWEGLEKITKADQRTSGNGQPLETPISSLSIGARQRVMLARILALPRALILDEPDENLDSGITLKLRQSVLRGDTRTVIAIATHEETLLESVATCVNLETHGR